MTVVGDPKLRHETNSKLKILNVLICYFMSIAEIDIIIFYLLVFGMYTYISYEVISSPKFTVVVY